MHSHDADAPLPSRAGPRSGARGRVAATAAVAGRLLSVRKFAGRRAGKTLLVHMHRDAAPYPRKKKNHPPRFRPRWSVVESAGKPGSAEMRARLDLLSAALQWRLTSTHRPRCFITSFCQNERYSLCMNNRISRCKHSTHAAGAFRRRNYWYNIPKPRPRHAKTLYSAARKQYQ